ITIRRKPGTTEGVPALACRPGYNSPFNLQENAWNSDERERTNVQKIYPRCVGGAVARGRRRVRVHAGLRPERRQERRVAALRRRPRQQQVLTARSNQP